MTIPSDVIVKVNPSVLSAGGSGLELRGLFLSDSLATPIGQVLSFPTANAVGNYYGFNSYEYAYAVVYFRGFDNSTIKPASILFTQYNQSDVYPYLRGGSAASMSLSQLRALNGIVSLNVNGVPKTSSTINLSSANSFSAASALIQAGFTGANLYDAITGSGSTIAAGTATSITASISGYTMTVSNVSTGALVVGGVLSGTGVATGTAIVEQLTGDAGEEGTYRVSLLQDVLSTTITQSYGLLTVSTIASGTLAVGQEISGGTTIAGTKITALGTGTGGAGTYITSGGAQTVSSTVINAGPLAVIFDSQSQAFMFIGGTPGDDGQISFASNTLSTPLLLTQATGAVLSQGADASTPGEFMNKLIQSNTNWATLVTTFDPDHGAGNAQKLLFAAWINSKNQRYLYPCSDTDITPTLSAEATTSLGYILKQTNSSGTVPISDPNGDLLNAFVAGYAASVDFNAVNGRTNLAFRSQEGIPASTTNETAWDNLIANGYNSYGAYATANDGFVFFYPGSVSGSYKWVDSYINQIWLNNQFQLDLMNMLVGLKSIPYNAIGTAHINAALTGTIQQALMNGVIQTGVTLSSLQIAQVNTAAGLQIDKTLSSQGWYLQVLPALPQVRVDRGTPPVNFWYMDGGSIQKIEMASIEIQ